MKQLYLLWAALCLSFLLTGCIGIEPALSGKEREEYLKSISIQYSKEHLEYWEKDGATQEERSRESINCGGSRLSGPYFSDQKMTANRRDGENDFVVRGRLVREWQRCMLGKGYRYTGKCLDTEISRASPACGAP